MSILGTYLSEKFLAPHPAAPRIDDNLPLNLKIGSLVGVESTPIIAAKRAGFLVDRPERQPIAGLGVIRYQGIMIYRFYFNDDVHMLQVAVDGAGKMTDEPFLYKRMPDVRPQSAEELALWLADESRKDPKTGSMTHPRTRQLLDSGYIGYQTFNLWDFTVTPPPVIATYGRVWKPNVGEQALREVMHEDLYRDPTRRPIRIEHQLMMYGRKAPNPGAFPEGIEPPDEWLQVSYSTYPDDAVVQTYVGLPIHHGMINVVLS